MTVPFHTSCARWGFLNQICRAAFSRPSWVNSLLWICLWGFLEHKNFCYPSFWSKIFCSLCMLPAATFSFRGSCLFPGVPSASHVVKQNKWITWDLVDVPWFSYSIGVDNGFPESVWSSKDFKVVWQRLCPGPKCIPWVSAQEPKPGTSQPSFAWRSLIWGIVV